MSTARHAGQTIEGTVLAKEVDGTPVPPASVAAPVTTEYPWWVSMVALIVAGGAFCSWLGITPPVCANACVFNWVAGLAATAFLAIGLRYLFGRLRERGGRRAVIAAAILVGVAYGILMSPKSGLAAPLAQEPVWLVVAALAIATIVAWARR